jgi:DhnA family fructose-bisphosphate aldolase class Ia
MYGCIDPKPSQKVVGADLGLYSITFTNNLDEEHQALREFQEFRLEAERKGFRYFLEVFNPNVEPGISEAEIPAFVNDHIIRSMAGVTKCGRPLFLKIAYNGPKALSELVSYDPQLIVGILGGSAGTTYDAFKLISDAQKYGARVALFGRKINLSEHPLTFLEKLRQIVDHQISAEEAVKAYHDALQRLRIRPLRELAEDMKLTGTMMRYR